MERILSEFEERETESNTVLKIVLALLLVYLAVSIYLYYWHSPFKTMTRLNTGTIVFIALFQVLPCVMLVLLAYRKKFAWGYFVLFASLFVGAMLRFMLRESNYLTNLPALNNVVLSRTGFGLTCNGLSLVLLLTHSLRKFLQISLRFFWITLLISLMIAVIALAYG